jgi:hypothetical protein
MSADHISVIENFWNKECNKVSFAFLFDQLFIFPFSQIKDSIYERSCWNGGFSHLSWRVDVKVLTKDSIEINEPIALFEIRTKLSSMSQTSPTTSCATFEMDRSELEFMIQSIRDAEAKLIEISVQKS